MAQSGEPARDCKTVHIKRVTPFRFGPEHWILVVQIHAGRELARISRNDEFTGTCDLRQLITGSLLVVPKRFVFLHQPLRGLQDKGMHFGKGFHPGARNLQIQATFDLKRRPRHGSR